MKSNHTTIAYWVSTIIVSLFLFADGLAGVLHVRDGKDSMLALGYPMYVLTIVGSAKIIAAFSIVQKKWKTLKEWAFAGYAVTCIGAGASQAYSHQPILFVIMPFIFLMVAAVPYILWKKQLKTH